MQLLLLYLEWGILVFTGLGFFTAALASTAAYEDLHELHPRSSQPPYAKRPPTACCWDMYGEILKPTR